MHGAKLQTKIRIAKRFGDYFSIMWVLGATSQEALLSHEYTVCFSLFMTNDFCEIVSESEEWRMKSEEFPAVQASKGRAATASSRKESVAVANSSLFTLHSSLLTPWRMWVYTFTHRASHRNEWQITLWLVWHDGVMNVSSGCDECSDWVWRMFCWGVTDYRTTVRLVLSESARI